MKKEPKIIDRGTAAKLWAEGDDRVYVKGGLIGSWALVTGLPMMAFRDTGLEFALIPAEPKIVKPVVVTFHHLTAKHITEIVQVGDLHEHTDYTVTIRPKSQQDERDRLEREFVESMEAKTIFDPAKAIALRDFIKKEQA